MGFTMTNPSAFRRWFGPFSARSSRRRRADDGSLRTRANNRSGAGHLNAKDANGAKVANAFYISFCVSCAYSAFSVKSFLVPSIFATSFLYFGPENQTRFTRLTGLK